jgi:hypothetical protein
VRLNGTHCAPVGGGSPASQPACRGSVVDFVARTDFEGRPYADLDVVSLPDYALEYRTVAAAEKCAAFRVALTMDVGAVWTAVMALYGVTGSYLA